MMTRHHVTQRRRFLLSILAPRLPDLVLWFSNLRIVSQLPIIYYYNAQNLSVTSSLLEPFKGMASSPRFSCSHLEDQQALIWSGYFRLRPLWCDEEAQRAPLRYFSQQHDRCALPVACYLIFLFFLLVQLRWKITVMLCFKSR